MCLESFSGRSQQASLTMNSSTAGATSRVSELASTQTVNLFPSTYQFPCTGSVSVSMFCRAVSCTSSSHPDDTDVARRFMAATTTLSQPHTGKWPTSFPQTEKTLRCVTLDGTPGTSPPLLQWSPSSLPLTCKPSTFAPSRRCSSSLHVSLKLLKCSLTAWADRMPSFTKMSSM